MRKSPETAEEGARRPRKKLRKKAHEAELKEAGRQAAGKGGKRKILALQNGGVGDSARSSGPGVVKKPKGKGRGKLKDNTDNNESICFNWWKGKPCHTNPCPHKHVCRICEGPHQEKDCPKRG